MILQPDLGQTLLIAMVWLTLIFVSGINIYLFFIFFIFMSLIVSYLIFFVSKFEYIKFRFLSFINSSEVGNYQAEKASDAIISGGFFGKGIGEGTLNSKIPEAHTDYIVSVVSEEFGAIIVIIIILLYLIFAYKIIQKKLTISAPKNFEHAECSVTIRFPMEMLEDIQTFHCIGIVSMNSNTVKSQFVFLSSFSRPPPSCL